MPRHALGRADRHAFNGLAENRGQDTRLGDVADRGAGGVGTDVIYVRWVAARVGERLADGSHRRLRIGTGDHHVEGVASRPIARHFGIDTCLTPPRHRGWFQYEYSPAVGHDETVALAVKW